MATVWQRDNPGVRGEIEQVREDWDGRAWRFKAQVGTGVLNLDNYEERNFHALRMPL